jgi:hypothetical protein
LVFGTIHFPCAAIAEQGYDVIIPLVLSILWSSWTISTSCLMRL